jgi:hypothetical protein
MKVQARSRRPLDPMIATPAEVGQAARAVTERVREDFVIARPSELHPRYGPVADEGRPARSGSWTRDPSTLADSVADGVARGRALISSIPRMAEAVILAARDGADRAVPALAVAGIAILISLAALMLAGAWLR